MERQATLGMVLDKKNYTIWYKRLESMCMGNEIEDILVKDYADKKVEQADKKSQGKALFYIRSSLTEEDERLIANCSYAKEALEVLKASKVQKTDISNLQIELNRLEWGKDSAELFISKLNDIRSRMRVAAGETAVQDVLFTTKITDQMPKFMRQVADEYRMKAWRGETIKYESYTALVVSAYRDLLQEKEYRSERQSQEANTAFYAQVRRCDVCFSPTHLRKFCPENPYNQRTPPQYQQSSFNNFQPNNQHSDDQRSNQQFGYNDFQQHPNYQQDSVSSNLSNFNGQRANNQNYTPPQQQHQHQQSQSSGRFGLSSGNAQAHQQLTQNSNQTVGFVQQVNPEPIHEHPNVAYCMFPSSAQPVSDERPLFFVDTCSAFHLVNGLTKFDHTYKPLDEPEAFTGAGVGYGYGIGNVPVRSRVQNRVIQFELSNAYFTPRFSVNIISYIQMQNNGIVFKLSDSAEFHYLHAFTPDGAELFTAKRPRGTINYYAVELEFDPPPVLLVEKKMNKVMLQPTADLHIESEPYADRHHYLSMVGSIHLIAAINRADVKLAAGKIALFKQKPTVQHAKLAIKVIQYLFSTSVLRFRDHGQKDRIGVIDEASLYDVEHQERATTGVVVQHNGNPKHYNQALLFVRDYVNRNKVVLEHIGSKENVDDLLAKQIEPNIFTDLVRQFGIKRSHP